MEKKVFYLCHLSEESEQNNSVHLSQLYLSRKQAESRKILFHYTTIEALLKIASTSRIKFSRIDKVNDPLEKEPLLIEDLYKTTFVSCFNHDNDESIPLWKMYTSQGLGVRIGFFFKENNIPNCLIDQSRPVLDPSNNEIKWINTKQGQVNSGLYFMIKDVQYSDKGYDGGCTSLNEDSMHVMPDCFGAIKSTIWEYEKETRLVIYLLDYDLARELDANYLLLPIDFSALEYMEITFDPWMSSEMKKCLKLGLEEYQTMWNLEIRFKDSDLCNRIK